MLNYDPRESIPHPFLPALLTQFFRPFQLTPGGPHLISKLSSKGSTAPVRPRIIRVELHESKRGNHATPLKLHCDTGPSPFYARTKTSSDRDRPLSKYQGFRGALMPVKSGQQHADRRRQGVLSHGPCMSSDRDRIKPPPPSSRVEGPSINDVGVLGEGPVGPKGDGF